MFVWLDRFMNGWLYGLTDTLIIGCLDDLIDEWMCFW